MASMTNNGWPKDPAVTRVYVGGDSNGCEFRAGDVAVVFQYFFERFHREVEPVYMLNGYRSSGYNATIPGSVASSNHISATAGDVNGDRHPNEARAPRGIKPSGFSPAQVAAINQLLADFGCIVWGGRTSAKFPVGSRDYMHFEVAGGTAAAQRLAAVADWVRAQNAPKPVPPKPTPPPPEPENLEEVMPYPRYYRLTNGNLAWEDLGTARRRTSLPQYKATSAQYPKGIGITAIPANDPFWDLPIVGDAFGEGYQQSGKPAVWVSASDDNGAGRSWVDAETYAKEGKPVLTVLPNDDPFWTLPVIGTSPA